ncbi:hypothetical protein FHU33_4626 [Blastococcus colisei]|uniref:Polysaccharide biosynthesis protein C-terminal domain-containing protein n=2 Tax=Blastococcus colisei TaxID=1564162 RepID=A0A543P1I3_9ACTN|nr:hypothetical protein FHU33_4626 [Blastococcus colisei]
MAAVGGIVVGLSHGIVGVAAGLLIANWISVWFFVVPALRLAAIRLQVMVRSVAFVTLAAILSMGAALVPRFTLYQSHSAIVLAAQLGASALVYLILIWFGERDYLIMARGKRSLT